MRILFLYIETKLLSSGERAIDTQKPRAGKRIEIMYSRRLRFLLASALQQVHDARHELLVLNIHVLNRLYQPRVSVVRAGTMAFPALRLKNWLGVDYVYIFNAR
jgi:hypothetical protein